MATQNNTQGATATVDAELAQFLADLSGLTADQQKQFVRLMRELHAGNAAAGAEPTTVEVGFDRVFGTNKDLLTVADGAPVASAIMRAECLEDSVLNMLREVVMEGEPMSVARANVCRLALEAAGALRLAAGQSA